MTQVHHREAVTPGGGYDFVVSDGSRDRYGTRINPNGWVLKSFKRNPIALFGHASDFVMGRWENIRVEGDRVLATLVPAARGTSARIDELLSLLEQGILRACSVGFTVLQIGEKTDPYEYMQQELLEISVVSVPGNSNALAVARSMNISDETLSLAFDGEQAQTKRRDVPTGEQAQSPNEQRSRVGLPPLKKDTSMSPTLSSRIENAQSELNAARDALTAHLDSDSGDTDQTEALSAEIETRETRLSSLKRAEQALASRTSDGGGDQRGEKPKLPSVRKPLSVNLREPKPEDLIVRAAVCNALAFATGKDAIRIMEDRYGGHEATEVVVRAAVEGAKTTTAGWAAELVETAMGAFMESLRPISIYPQLAGLGTKLSFGPGRAAIKLPSRAPTPSVSGSFVAEGAPIPVRRMGLTSVTLTPNKLGVISVFSREIARYSNPQIEGLLRQEIQADTAITIDTLLLDAVAGSATRPAGLTNGVTALTASTAGGYQAILEDIATLAAPFDTANAGRSLVLLLNPKEARLLKMTPGPNASGFGWAAQFLEEFTIIRSTTIPAGHVYLIDAADFATAAGDAPEFDVTEQTVLHMEDSTPAHLGVAGTPNVAAAPAQSMFQTAQLALRMIMDMTWAMRRQDMVQHIAAVDWAPST